MDEGTEGEHRQIRSCRFSQVPARQGMLVSIQLARTRTFSLLETAKLNGYNPQEWIACYYDLDERTNGR